MRWRSFRAGGMSACPQGQQHRHDVAGRHLVDALVTDAGVCVIAQAPPPLPAHLLGVLPDLAVDRDHSLCRVLESRHAACPASVGYRIPARTRDLAVGQRQRARFGQRHKPVASEAECAGLAADHEALHPTPGAGGVDVQVKAVAVAVPPRLADVAAERSREGPVGMWAPALPVRPLPGQWKHSVFRSQFQGRVWRKSPWATRAIISKYLDFSWEFSHVRHGMQRRRSEKRKADSAPNATRAGVTTVTRESSTGAPFATVPWMPPPCRGGIRTGLRQLHPRDHPGAADDVKCLRRTRTPFPGQPAAKRLHYHAVSGGPFNRSSPGASPRHFSATARPGNTRRRTRAPPASGWRSIWLCRNPSTRRTEPAAGPGPRSRATGA